VEADPSCILGKQTVYHATQEESDETSADAIAAMDEEIQRLQEELPGLKEEEKKVQAELSSLNAVPLLSELRTELEKLESEKESLAASLAKVHGDGEANGSPQETEAVRKDWKLWQVQARVRERICRDLWLKCSETLPEGTTREELWVCISASPSKLQPNRLFRSGWVSRAVRFRISRDVGTGGLLYVVSVSCCAAD
jgi:26S proteasome regulatory subunit (ATPase 3-interacting protein)